MIVFIVRRLLMGVGVVWALASLCFAAMYLSGNPVAASLEALGTPPAEVTRIVHEMGYDRPFLAQYFSFLGDALHGDFGRSFRYGVASSELIGARVPATLELALAAVIFTVVLAVPLGTIAGITRKGLVDQCIQAFVSFGQAVPTFVAGPLLILLLAVTWHVLPFGNADSLAAVILPALTLSIHPVSRITRVLRASMRETASMEYVRTARAKGLATTAVTVRHVLRNALLPVVTMVGLELTALVGGAVVVENVFGWPGLGTLTKNALMSSDYLLALGCIIYIGAAVVIVNVVTDCIYSFVDPRVTLR